MQIANDAFNPTAFPWHSGIGPSGSHMKHKNVLFSRSRNKPGKCISVKAETIEKSQRHSRPFIGKATAFRCNLVQPVGYPRQILALKGHVIALQEETPYVLQAVLYLRM